jgi:LacI family transcriptional regulator
VSTATVSHVLNNTRHVHQGTRRKVLDAVEQLGYEPNSLARSLRRSETLTIGVLVSAIDNPFYTAVIRGIEDVAEQERYSVIVCSSDERRERQDQYLRALSQRRIDGLIIAPTGSPSDELALRCERGLPIVFLDRRQPGMRGPLVAVDSVAAAHTAVAHLIDDLERDGKELRVGIITGLPAVSTSADRLHGYLQALEERSVPVDQDLIREGDSTIAGGRESARALLSLPVARRPTGLFVGNNLLTLGALQVIYNEMAGRIRCPEDLAIIGFDDHDWAQIVTPPLTVMAQPTHELGTRAARLLLQRIRGEASPDPTFLGAELRVRGSCSATHRQR